MAHRVLSDKTYLLLGLRSSLNDNVSDCIPYVKAKLFQMDTLGRIFLVQSSLVYDEFCQHS